MHIDTYIYKHTCIKCTYFQFKLSKANLFGNIYSKQTQCTVFTFNFFVCFLFKMFIGVQQFYFFSFSFLWNSYILMNKKHMLTYLPSASHYPEHEYRLSKKNLTDSNYDKNWQVLAKHTHITEVKGVYSGLYEERIVWGQMRLELSFLVLCFILQLWKKEKK